MPVEVSKSNVVSSEAVVVESTTLGNNVPFVVMSGDIVPENVVSSVVASKLVIDKGDVVVSVVTDSAVVMTSVTDVVSVVIRLSGQMSVSNLKEETFENMKREKWTKANKKHYKFAIV